MEENNDLQLISTALQNFDRVSAGLALLEKNYKGVLFDVETELGMAHAKAARAKIREPRYEIERARKEAKGPLLRTGKHLDSEAARITTALLTLETPIHEQIVEEESRVERERLARLKAEEDRKAAINVRIGELRGAVAMVERYKLPSKEIAEHIADLEVIPVDESFAEFQQQATDAKLATLARLRELHTAALEGEAQAERARLEREELDRLRAEQKARDDASAAVKAAEELHARIAREGEESSRRAQQEEANRAVAEENRRQTEALVAQKAELDRQAAALRSKEAPPVAVESPKVGVPKVPPTLKDMEQVLATHYRVSTDTVHKWILAKVVRGK